jgi:hypothetical protein
MSDEEVDYNSSDESSSDEIENESKFASININNANILSLQDNEDDTEEFQRPDKNEVYEEGEDEEEEGEGDGDYLLGEDEESIDFEKRRQRKIRSNSIRSNKININKGRLNNRIVHNEEKKKKKKKKQIGICMTATKYECVRRVARKLGFKEVEENDDWSLYWTDTSVSIDRVNQMKRWQVRD